MKARRKRSLSSVVPVLAGFGLAALVFCNLQAAGSPSEERPNGNAEATWKFWEAFNKAATSGTGIEALQSPAWQGDVDTAATCAVLEDIIAGERERSHIITVLPVLHVDPDLAGYAVQFARSRTDFADALQDYVEIARKQGQMTSTPVLGVGLLLNLLNHSDDKKDGILWRALLDEGRQTAENLQTLREPLNAFEAKAASVRGVVGRLNSEEMGVRVKLAQRFDREFPPHETYTNSQAYERSKDTPLSKKQIIKTLIGQRVGGLLDLWTFDYPKEFVTFDILKVTKRSGVRTDYEVRTHVKGIPSGKERDFNLHLSYGWIYTRWVLVEPPQLQ
jgi:hypothetical protein